MSNKDAPIAQDAYDEIAETYAVNIDTKPYNADLEFPGTTDLIPDIAGKRTLDAGCGTGRYTEWLLDRGAEVVAVDASTEMIQHAAERVGDRAEIHQVDLEKRLDFADDNEFDGIVSSLTLHYIKNWREVFAEFTRILKPGGFFVFSVNHPVDDYLHFTDTNYFEVTKESMGLESLGESVEVPFYRRPFFEIINPLVETDFQLDTISAPKPTDRFKQKNPDAYEERIKQPTFLCIKSTKV